MAATIPKPPTDHGGGLKRISLLLQPVDEAILARNADVFLPPGGRGPRHPCGRSLFGLQGDGSSQLRYLESCSAAGSQVPKDIERFLRWNLTTQHRAELTSANASALLNDTL